MAANLQSWMDLSNRGTASAQIAKVQRNSLRITHFIGSLHPGRGGPATVVPRLAAAQANLGHKVRVVFCGNAQDQKACEANRDVAGIDGVEFRLISDGGRRPHRCLSEVRKAAIDSDIFHLHGVWELLVFLAGTTAFKRGIPYTVRPAGMLSPWSLNQKSRKKRLALSLGFRKMLSRAAFVHALNVTEESHIQKLGLCSPIRVIPNGVCLEELSCRPRDGGFRSTIRDLGDRAFVLFLARLRQTKGLDILADAFTAVALECTDLDLVVAGEDDGEAAVFQKAISANGISEQVHVVGPLYGARKFAALAEATCFVLPSHHEGFSLAILEAMASKCPVIVSEECNFPELTSCNAGRVLPLKADEFSRAILEVHRNQSLRARLSNNAYDMICEKYTWQKVAIQSISAYEGVRK